MKKSLLSRIKQTKLIEYFVAGVTARCAADLVGVNRKTGGYYFHRLREIIFLNLAQEAEAFFGGEVEVDESYFGGRRKGKRGRGATGKVPVFGMLKRGGKVYTKIIPDASSTTLIPIIQGNVPPPIVVYILIAGEVIMCWMYPNLNITDLIIQRCLRIRKITSTG